MATMQVKVTAQPDVEILGCPRCDTALLPHGDWPAGGTGLARCPLCGWEQPVEIIEVGAGFPYNPMQQRQDADETPVYRVAGLSVEEDLLLVDVPDLLEDPAFFALQNGEAPVASLGWVGGEGLLGDAGYRLFLVVRVRDLPEEDLFRVEFTPEVLPQLSLIDADKTLVLVSQRKGVFFPESGEVYLEAVQAAGARPGDRATMNTWVELRDEA